jgi:FKBP-type peptidyl-prolyl cis-trans isomerase FklB
MTMKIFSLSLAVVLVAHGLCMAADGAGLNDQTDKINYSLGFQIGGDFRRQGFELRPEILVKGIQDALAESDPLMPRQEMHETLVALKEKVMAQQKTRLEEVRSQDQKFLAANAQREGVFTLPSGLQYEKLVQGSGKTPETDDLVRVNFRGTDISGKEFTRGEGEEFKMANALPGLKEGLLLMQEGAKWRIFLPEELAYGDNTPLADRCVIFEVELLKVLPGP